ncbi:MAG: hypothetical protein SFY81_14100 [Verrucomicrobiota bacterium]|nr:hypothetical protein [Verrucomicrobiota bacterium]
MNFRNLIVATLLVFFTAISHAIENARAKTRYVVGLSPFLEKSSKDEVYRRVATLLVEDLPIHSSLTLYDAYHLRTITTFEIPDVLAFKTGRTRAAQFKGEFRKLKEFLASESARPKTELDLNGAVRLPQFLDFVAEHQVREASPLTMIILGSPLYLDQKEPGFSMVNGFFPSDGHLLATREQSIYGAKNRSGLLNNLSLHFGYFGDPWLSELHQEKIGRFWSLYLKEQGAVLSTFTSDLATVFKAAASERGEIRRNYAELDRTASKLEMLRITRDIGVTDWITRELPANLPQPPPGKTVGPMKIGIRWQGNLDLDLYASATPDSETLFFEHTRAPEGYYFKDHRSSPEREYEFIEFETPVDLFKLQASINFYHGDAPNGATGEVRIEFDGRIYTGSFTIPARHGNEGRTGRHQQDFWTKIDLLKILKLTPATAAGL